MKTIEFKSLLWDAEEIPNVFGEYHLSNPREKTDRDWQKEIKFGEVVDIKLKPTYLRGWEYRRETKKCLVFYKEKHPGLLVPKKNIIMFIKKSEKY